MKSDAKLHSRENKGLLAVPEKIALNWLARKMPSKIHSDHLTVIGLGAMVGAGLSFWASGIYKPALFFVIFFLAVNWFGDSLDGTLARYRNCQRPRYGYYVDHVVDLVGTSALVGGMALSGFMSPLIAVALLATFSLVEAEVFLATHVQKIFRLSCFGFGPTELRVLISIGAIYIYTQPTVSMGNLGRFLLLDVGGILSITGLLTAFIYSAIRNTRNLYLAEPRGL